MNDEIKEIEHIMICLKEHIALSDDEDTYLLDYITNLEDTLIDKQECINAYNEIINNRDKKITNLQQENERLKVDEHFFTECGFTNIEQLALCYVDYKSRCEKASEYIEHRRERVNPEKTIYVNGNDLLNILQNGSDSQ